MSDDDGPTASLIFFLVLVLINFFFYGFGAAIRELNEKEIGQEAEEEKNKRAVRLLHIIQKPERYVNTVQLVTTLSNLIIGGWYLRFVLVHIHVWMEKIVAYFGVTEPEKLGILSAVAVLLTLALLLYVVLTFGVLLPKKLALRSPKKWAYTCINPVFYLTVLLRPLTGLITLSTHGVLRLFGLRPDEEASDVTEEEILSMVNEGHEQGVIEASEAQMINNIFEYGDKEAQDIMTHRSNIVGIDAESTLGEAIRFMLSEKNSRYPVYEENLDHIVGILHLKDALRSQAAGIGEELCIKDIPGLLRQARFIPLTRNIDDLFKSMQSQKLQMVIVVDEYGQTAGLIAMEDILEEIVGNILDEYDEEERFIQKRGNDEYIIDGKTPLEELEEKLGITFDQEDFETLNGYLISKLDHIPEDNEQFDVDVCGYNFKILSVEHKRIQSVLVTPIRKTEEEQEEKQSKEKE